MDNTDTQILTPDQRLRVFISSTLNELAEERLAVKEAIQQIHLTPVMFEMGARPHAPRNLYRQYLAQSQIFVGIYWEKYGWVAPEESVSGLEDEYNLSGNMPKLIYIKKEQGKRETRLSALLERIQLDDKVSYKTFSSSEELSQLIVNDLALLLTERFNLTLQDKVTESVYPSFTPIPSVPNSLIGRENAIQEIQDLLDNPSIRLLTLTGPGGIGKTRLAMETVRLMQHQYQDGAAYVALAPVRTPSLVAETICYNLGVKVSGGNNLDSLRLFLQHKRFLLLLDNFEQVIEAASIIDDLLLAAPGLKIVVTSRERLALSFEHVYVVPTLSTHVPDRHGAEENLLPPSVELFVARAKAVDPAFTLHAQNRETVMRICERLEGLPLAIELAAGQINLFSPALLLQKLNRSLDVLQGSFRDIPDRQRTMRNTVAWSYDLLSPGEQQMLLQMSLYVAGCMLKAIEQMHIEGQDSYTTLSSLLNKSLLIRQEEGEHLRFQMYESVREFAHEQLKENGLEDVYRQQLADFYVTSLEEMRLQKSELSQSWIMGSLEKEHANIRVALEFLMQRQDIKKVTSIAWCLWLFWWVNAHTREGYTWLKQAWDMNKTSAAKLDDFTYAVLAANVGFMSFLQRDMATFTESLGQHLDFILQQDDDELVATTTLITGVVKTIKKEHEVADQLLHMSLERFTRLNLTTGISLALSALGRNKVYNGNQTTQAKEYYRRSMEFARKDRDEISVIITLAGFALCEVMEKNSDAKNYLRECILLSQSLHFFEALAWSIEIWSLVSINEGKLNHAVTLMGAVDHLRQSTELPVWEDLQAIILEAKRKVEAIMEPMAFTRAWDAGVAMSLDGMVAYAMGEVVE